MKEDQSLVRLHEPPQHNIRMTFHLAARHGSNGSCKFVVVKEQIGAGEAIQCTLFEDGRCEVVVLATMFEADGTSFVLETPPSYWEERDYDYLPICARQILVEKNENENDDGCERQYEFDLKKLMEMGVYKC